MWKSSQHVMAGLRAGHPRLGRGTDPRIKSGDGHVERIARVERSSRETWEGPPRASWFETALKRLITMRRWSCASHLPINPQRLEILEPLDGRLAFPGCDDRLRK